jgi:hypothetical protein
MTRRLVTAAPMTRRLVTAAPHAANTDGNPFHAQPGTPSVNGLTPALLSWGHPSFAPYLLDPATGEPAH